MTQTSRHQRPATKLFDHVRELRMRLLASAIAMGIAGTGVYFVYEPLLAILRAPLNQELYYSNPAGSFAFVMKICFMGALVLTIPVIVYNLVMFVRPVFDGKLSRIRIYSTTALSIVFAGAGATFAFLVIIPGALKFFAGFQVSGLSALISADSYLGFVTNVIITFVVMFQLPLLIAFVDGVHPLPPKKLFAMEKWVILASLIISLIVPFAFDVMTCLMIALPIIVLYNIAIFIVILQHAGTKRKAKIAAKVTAKKAKKAKVIKASVLSASSMPFENATAVTTPIMPELPVNVLTENVALPEVAPARRPDLIIADVVDRELLENLIIPISSIIGQAPQPPAAPASPKVVLHQRPVIDVRPMSRRLQALQPTLKPAAPKVATIPDHIVNRQKKARVISDIQPKRAANPALTSQ